MAVSVGFDLLFSVRILKLTSKWGVFSKMTAFFGHFWHPAAARPANLAEFGLALSVRIFESPPKKGCLQRILANLAIFWHRRLLDPLI